MRVSIITPCFNGEKTIRQCIDSIRMQDYPEIEHIVVDGGSRDGTLKVLDSLNVSYVSGPDAGIYDAMNKGIKLATGDVVGILNCDDFYADQKVISDVVECFHRTRCDICHGKIVQVDSNEISIWTVGGDFSRAQLLRKMRVAHPSVFVKSDVYQRFGGFSVGFRIAGDYEFLLRIWGKVKISYLDRVMVRMRMDGVSQSNVNASYRESLAAVVLHGGNLALAYFDYWAGRLSHFVVEALRRLGFRRTE